MKRGKAGYPRTHVHLAVDGGAVLDKPSLTEMLVPAMRVA
jgi:hypothetical protein